jgi:Spy/CpxP family protein refolding chaperone
MPYRSFRTALLVAAAAWLLLVATGTATGQERQKWWLSDWAKADLGLTEDQSREIEAVFQSLLPRMRAEKEAFDRENAALSKLMLDGASERAIGPAIDRVETTRGAVNKTRTWMLVRMYRVLTPEQRVKLQARHERREQGRPDRVGDGPPK